MLAASAQTILGSLGPHDLVLDVGAEYWAAPEEARVHALFWEGEVRARERIFIGHEEHDAYVADLGRHRGARR